LCSHWKYEIEKFCDYLRPLLYAGPQRKQLRAQVDRSDVVIVSYDVLRNEIDFFKTFKFSYCILDEGHIIKVAYLFNSRCLIFFVW
jgi:TATA-binding protein-associated factor